MAQLTNANLAMDYRKPPSTISELGAKCARGLGALVESSCTPDNARLVYSLEDESGRFRVWASNIGALQPERSAASLESRLKDALKLRESVILALERLQSAIDRTQSILTGELPNRTASPLEISGGDSEIRSEPTSELEQLILNIHSSISHLFSLSTLIRKRRPKGRLPQLSSFVPLESSPDIKHIEDKFPKAKKTPWLTQRLGNAIAQRREIIQYRQNHRTRLAMVDPGEDESALGKRPGTVATTFEDSEQGDAKCPDDRQSIFTSATSFISSYGSNMGRQIPDLPDMTLEGVRLKYGEPIECPYCRTIQVLENRIEWRRHVFSDLQPYVCTFEDCTSELFETRQQWFGHEMNVHRQQWICVHCGDSNATFGTKAALQKHLEAKHSSNMTENQLSTILAACQRPPQPYGPSECPLCDEWEPPVVKSQNVKEFCRHLARHQHLLALEALPISIEGLELDASAYDSDAEEDPEKLKSRTNVCNDCEIVWAASQGKTCPRCDAFGETQNSFAEALKLALDKDQFFASELPLDIVGGRPVLWMAASLFEFNINPPKQEAGYPYLAYVPGEIFDVFLDKGDLWLATNQDDPDHRLGWLWPNHFAKLPHDTEL